MKLASLLLPAATIAAMGHPLVLLLPHSADSASIPDQYNQNHHSLQSSEEDKPIHWQSWALLGNGDFHAILRSFHDQDDIDFSKPPALSTSHHRGRKIMSESLFIDGGQEGEQNEGLSEKFHIDDAAALPAKGGNVDTDILGEIYYGSVAMEKIMEIEKEVEVNVNVDQVSQAEGGIFDSYHQDGGIPQDVVIIEDALTAQEMKTSKKSNNKKKNNKNSSGKSGKSSSSKSSSKSRKRSKAKKKKNKKKKKRHQPTIFPTMFPTNSPMIPDPTVDPSMSPSGSPRSHPTNNPSRSPTDHPTINPTSSPTGDPTNNPTTTPSTTPSMLPTTAPSTIPSHKPTPTSTLSEVTQTGLQMVLSGESIPEAMKEEDVAVFEIQTAEYITHFYNDGSGNAASTTSFIQERDTTSNSITGGLRKLTTMEKLKKSLAENEDVHIVASAVSVTQQTLSQNPSSLTVEYATSLLYRTTSNPTNEDVGATNNEGVKTNLVTAPFETPESREIYLTQYLQSGTSGSEFFTQIDSVSEVSLPDETYQPSLAPTNSPSSIPSDSPSYHPSLTPSTYPSKPPSPQPTISPVIPTSSPTFAPTIDPETVEDIFVNSTFHLALIQQSLYLNGTILNITANDTLEMEDVTRKFLFDNIGGESKFQVENLTIDEIAVERQQLLQRLVDGVVIDDDDEEVSFVETIVFRMNVLFRMKASFVEWIENGQEGDDDYDFELDEEGEGYFDTAGVRSGERRKLMMIITPPQWKNTKESMGSRLLKSGTCGRNDYAECCLNGAINEDADSKTCKEAGCTKKRCKKKPPKNRRVLFQHSRDGDFVVDPLKSIDQHVSWTREGRDLQASKSYWGLDFLDVIRQHTTNFEPNATKSILNATDTDSVATCTSNRYSEITNSSAFACDVYTGNNCDENEDLDLEEDKKCSSSAPSTTPSLSLAPSLSSMPSASSAPSVVPSIEPSSSPPTTTPTVMPNTPHPAPSCTTVPKAFYNTKRSISSVEEEAELDEYDSAKFGYSVSIWENVAAIGAPEAKVNSNKPGAVYIFEYKLNDLPTGQYEWVFIQKLTPSNSNGDLVGRSVSLYGEFLAVGAPYDEDQGGVVHVFRRPEESETFQQLVTLVSPTPSRFGYFGWSVAVDEDGDIAVGARRERSDQGSAHVYKRVAGPDWTLVQDLEPDISSFDFGWSIAMDRNFLVIGAPKEGKIGSVFVYKEQTADSWVFSEQLTPNDGGDSDEFGYSVAMDNNNLIVGSPFAATSKDDNAGRVYHYILNPLSTAILSSSVEAVASLYEKKVLLFGISISISRNLLLVGTFDSGPSIGSIGDIGSAHLFYHDGKGQWQFSQIILDDPPFRGHWPGWSVAINPAHALVGMPLLDDPIPGGGSVSQGGATYFFDVAEIEECAPSIVPSIEPSSSRPTMNPAATPNTPNPTQDPSESPSTSFAPTAQPTNAQSIPPSVTPSISSIPSTLSPTVCVSSTEYIAPLFDTECTEQYCFQHQVGVVDGGDIAVVARNFETILFLSKGSSGEFEIETSLEIDYVPFSMAIAGGFVFVGSPFGVNPLGSGLIHVYHSVSGVWSEAATYFPPDLDDEETFAMSIDIDSYSANENMIVVGSEVTGRGNLLRIFRCTGTSCAHEATLWPDDTEAEDQIWPAVSVNGDIVAFTDNHVYNGTKGAVYFAQFDSSTSTWQSSDFITNDDCGPASFGDSLAFTPDGEGLLVGCYEQDGGKGAVYYYTFSSTNNLPTLEQKISGINDDLFGYFTAMSIHDDILSIGTGSSSSGSVYLFRKENGLWNYLDTVVAPPGVGMFFGAITSLTSDENGDHDLLVSAGNNAYYYTYHECPSP